MTIPIQEVFTYPNKSHTLRVNEGQVELNTGASFAAALLDDSGDVTQKLGRVYLTDEQYADWGIDDSVVAEAVALNLGLVPITQ